MSGDGPNVKVLLLRVREMAMERWDISIAICAMLLGLVRLLGIRLVICTTLLAGGLAWKAYQSDLLPQLPRDKTSQPDQSTVTNITISPKSLTLTTLSNFLASSRQFDNTIEKSLSILQPLPPNSTSQYNLRLALSRLTSNMTDHLATATSGVLALADKEELGVLGEMYDIPVAGSFLYQRKPKRLDAKDEADSASWQPIIQSVPVGSIPSPRRPDVSLRRLGVGLSKDDSQPMSISRSLPGRFKPTHRTHHLSLSASPNLHPSLRSAPDDRFTQLPERTPRYNKRASWDSSVWSPIRDGGLAPSPSIRGRRLSRPSHERRITEADEGEAGSDAQSSPTPSTRPTSLDKNGLIPLSLPTSPTPISKPFTPRRSPLSGSVSDNSPRRSAELIKTFPSFPAFTSSIPNPKRRSLQNMPYYPSSDDDRVLSINSETDLTRTRSMPFSDIQAMRSKYATGSRSRGQSLVGQSPPTSNSLLTTLTSPTPAQPRIRRVVSVSPLTLPSLKAGCLGIHLKRRRLACCLIGLKFDEIDEAYWADITTTLEALIEAINAERTKLETECANAMVSELDSEAGDVQPPWTVPENSGSFEFAPRTSDEVLLRDRIREMENTLETAWRGLQAVKSALQLEQNVQPLLTAGSSESSSIIEPHGDLESCWKDVRGELGFLVRDWERGKEIVHRLAQPSHSRDVPDDTQVQVTTALPDFMNGWAAPEHEHDRAVSGGSFSTSFESDRQPESLDGQSDPEYAYDAYGVTDDLPLPGKDMVFEADLAKDGPVLRQRSALSRDERIRLTKQAREKGLTLDQILSGNGVAGDEPTMGFGGVEKETGRTHGLVVEEMKTMIGMIRAKKGVVDVP